MENYVKSGDNSPTSVDWKKSRKFFACRPCGLSLGPLEISHVTDHGGGSGRFRGGKRQQFAGNREQLEPTDLGHRSTRHSEGKPASGRSGWLPGSALSEEQGAGQPGLGTTDWLRIVVQKPRSARRWRQLLTSAAGRSSRERHSDRRQVGGNVNQSEAPLSRK